LSSHSSAKISTEETTTSRPPPELFSSSSPPRFSASQAAATGRFSGKEMGPLLSRGRAGACVLIEAP